MVLELNASDDRGIDVVRQQIKDFAQTQKLFTSGVKLIILDEADAMTNDAQFALRRIIEKYTKNTRFCLICNYVSKIIPALQSRCTRFRFAPLHTDQITSRLNYIIEKEELATRITDDGRTAILRLANGDMRRVLNILQATASGFEEISAESVYACTGNPQPADIQALLKILLEKDFSTSYDHLVSLSLTKGLALTDIVNELSRFLAAIPLPPEVRATVLERFADVEYRLAFGTNEKIQASALVSIFSTLKEGMKKYANNTNI